MTKNDELTELMKRIDKYNERYPTLDQLYFRNGIYEGYTAGLKDKLVQDLVSASEVVLSFLDYIPGDNTTCDHLHKALSAYQAAIGGEGE